MVKALIDLAERSITQSFDDFISESYMISYFTNVFSVLIIEAVVVNTFRRGSKQFWVPCIYVVDLFIL
jgi:hypothetical protein